jgi:hypothetical protein
VSRPEQMIAEALREIADQAGAPRPMADAAWRAGRRRRLAALTASAVTASAVLAAAVLVPLAARGGPPHRQPVPPASQQGPAAPVSLRSPIQFRQVAAMTHAPCPAGTGGLLDSAEHACIYLTRRGLTVTTARSALLVPGPGNGQSVLYLTLTRAQTRRFAALTRQVSGLENPRDQLAVIADGRLITHPAIQSPITDGQLQIVFATRAEAERLLSPGPHRCGPLPLTVSAAPWHPRSCR